MTLEPGITMEEMVNYALENGVIPLVVPEFPGISVGGAISGAALESSSFRYGQVCFELFSKPNEYQKLPSW